MTGSISLDWELGVHTERSIVSVWKIENSSSLRLPNPICLYFPPRHRRPITRLPLLWIENYQFTFIIDVTQICQDDIPIIFPAKISSRGQYRTIFRALF